MWEALRAKWYTLWEALRAKWHTLFPKILLKFQRWNKNTECGKYHSIVYHTQDRQVPSDVNYTVLTDC